MTRVNLTIHGYDAARWIIARRQNRQYEECVARFGTNARGVYFIHRLVDRRGILPIRVFYSDRPEGVALPADADDLNCCDDAFVAYPLGKPSVVAYGRRFSHEAGYLERYEPIDEIERERRSTARKAKAAERSQAKWNEAHPLFARRSP